MKQIKLVDVPKSELRMIEVSHSRPGLDAATQKTNKSQAEIHLLKDLHV